MARKRGWLLLALLTVGLVLGACQDGGAPRTAPAADWPPRRTPGGHD